MDAAAIAAAAPTLRRPPVLHFAPTPQRSLLTALPLPRNVFFSSLVAGPSNIAADAITAAATYFPLAANMPLVQIVPAPMGRGMRYKKNG